MEVLNLQISKSCVNTCKFEKPYFSISFQISFQFKTYHGFSQDDNGKLLFKKFAGEHFFQVNQILEKNLQFEPKLSKNVVNF